MSRRPLDLREASIVCRCIRVEVGGCWEQGSLVGSFAQNSSIHGTHLQTLVGRRLLYYQQWNTPVGTVSID